MQHYIKIRVQNFIKQDYFQRYIQGKGSANIGLLLDSDFCDSRTTVGLLMNFSCLVGGVNFLI